MVAAACCGLLWGSAGCVAVPAGKTEVFRHELAEVETGTHPERTRMERARVDLRQRGELAFVSIDAELAEDFARKRHVRQVTVRKQKRLAFGLFPEAAELAWMPTGALASAMTVGRTSYVTVPRYCGFYTDHTPSLWRYAGCQLEVFFLEVGLGHLAGTFKSLFVAPFEGFRCDSHDHYDREHWKRNVIRVDKVAADASSSPLIRAFSELPEEMRRDIGVRTCFDVRNTGATLRCGLVGFHKYPAVFVEVEELPAEIIQAETRMRKVAVEGPCEIELSIPGVGFSERRSLGRGETNAVFGLPAAAREMSIEARVSVREAPGAGRGDTQERTREAIGLLAGQASRFDVNLRADANGTGTGGAGSEAFEIVGIRPGRDGRYEVRVRVSEAGRRAAVAEGIAPEVRRRIREDYANRHSGARVADVRDWVAWQADEGNPAVLVFEGWAFAARALSEGWRYDGATRRGEVRVLVSGGVPEEQAAEWARENIAAIVADKGVALEAGGGGAEPAAFRCLGERFEGGVLCVEFEVAE